jgi:serine/threonine protein kinase
LVELILSSYIDGRQFIRQQLGAEIGRGGFGIVYGALDLRNGRSVAIKQVSLRDIDKDELLSIEVQERQGCQRL